MDLKRRNSSNRQVSRGVLDLPQEIIFDILSRLPIESILTCKVVCKTLCAVTRDPCFVNKLGSSHFQPTRLILKPLGENISDAPSHLVLLDTEECKARRIPFDNMPGNLEIMCSCNGLFCMASTKSLKHVVIYNPMTKERLDLPPSNVKSVVSHHEVGLGFDASTNKFKVVRAYTVSSSRGKLRFEIISLGERSWRKLSGVRKIVKRDDCGVVYWDGALYWRMNKGPFVIIIQFDLSDEIFRVCSFPDYFPPDGVSLGLIDVGGCLTLIQNEDNVVELWKLTGKKVGEDLTLCLQDTHDTHVKWGGGLGCEFVCQMNRDSYLLQVGFWNCQRQRQVHLTQYFPETAEYSNLEIPGLPNNFKTVCFKPSLIPLPPPAGSSPGDL